MLNASQIVSLHDTLTRVWHESATPADLHPIAPWLDLLLRQHRANFDLWHTEDQARAPEATDARIAQIKRQIDATNQLRNDLVEEIDRQLLDWLKMRSLPNPAAPLHSETAGLIVDRLSILSLKIFHTGEQAGRFDATEEHRQRNLSRLALLEEQRADLAACLADLWVETLSGRRRFKLYRQLKMYNDPSLNPAIYEKPSSKSVL